MKYNAYVQQRVRKVIAYRDIDLEDAIQFLIENKYGVIDDQNGTSCTLEELKNVKNIGPEFGAGPDYTITSGEQVPEDSYRELSRTAPDNPESSPDGDNQ